MNNHYTYNPNKMNNLSQNTDLLKRFPKFELSYETVSHKKVSPTELIAIAIPLGRKYFIWHTYKPGSSENACYLVGLDKDKHIFSFDTWKIPTSLTLSLGTIIYGTMFEPGEAKTPVFIAEDIYYYCGTNLSNLCFGNRIGFLREYVKTDKTATLPLMWLSTEYNCNIPGEISTVIGYTAHHIQYREIGRVAPYINVAIPKRGTVTANIPTRMSSATVAQKITATSVMNPIPRFDYSKPAYRYPAVFNVTADLQLDLYHLYAFKQSNPSVYCGLAGVQSLKTSMFMNRIFRRIRENDNLDLAEESEDETDFENTDANKYVNLDAVVRVECVFNQKHKKWIPVRLSNDKLIHIDKLISTNNNSMDPYRRR